MKKWLVFLIVPALALFAGMGWATTFTTPVYDADIGADWDADEQFETETFDNADYTLWITWDDLDGIYIGIDRIEDPENRYLGDNPENISLFVAVDTDQTPGSGAPVDWYQRVAFCGNYLPEFEFAFAGSGGWWEWGTWDATGDTFIANGWNGGPGWYGWDNNDDEVIIPWANIGNPDGVAIKVWITNEGLGDQAVLASWPTNNPVGDEPDPGLPWSYLFYPGRYYTAGGVSFALQPAMDIIPNATDISIPVTLSSFTATGREGAIGVSWTSQTEVNALAYHLLRSEKANGEYAEVYRCDASGNSEAPRDYRYLDSDVEIGQTYYYQLVDVDNEGNKSYHGPVFAAAGAAVPGAYSLLPNYPNPFNPSTAIGYEIPEASNVTLTIYNVLGQELRTLVDARQEAGSYTVMWDSKDSDGHYLNSGVYFYTLRAGDFTQTRKMVLMR